MTPGVAFAQNYQQHSDGLIAVTAKRIAEAGQQTVFEVCAQLVREGDAMPLDVRINLWGHSGGFLTQLSTVVRPGLSRPACQRIPLPPNIRGLRRWEIARFQFLREPIPHRAGGPNSAV
jgi:hypothetical protein